MMGDYKIPSITADIFIYDDNKDFILIKRKNDPFKDFWALPGGFVEYGESVETSAIREAKEETSIDVELKSLVGVYSKPDRDPRRHTITVAFTASGNFDDRNACDDASDIDIFSADDLDNIDLAFDHKEIIMDCLNTV